MFRRFISRTIKFCGLFLFGLVVFYLMLLSGFSTSLILVDQRTYLVSDNFWGNFILAAALTGIALWITYKSRIYGDFRERINSQPEYSAKWRRYLLILMGAILVIFALSVRMIPVWDQIDIVNIAQQWLVKNYWALNPGEYLDRFPNQFGIVVFLYYLSYLFGPHNYLVFNFLCAFCIVSVYRNFAQISDDIGRPAIEGLLIIVSGIFFLPLLMYVTFLYGNVLGLALSVSAIRHLNRYVMHGRPVRIVICALLMFAAMCIKSNYLILAVAMMGFLVYRMFRGYRHGMAVLIILLALASVSSSRFTRMMVESITGVETREGVASSAFVAMGLQDNDFMANGWFNMYISNSYWNNDSDTDKQRVETDAFIENRIEEFREDPMKALDFFSSKNASQWNNPTFQCFWINDTQGGRVYYPLWIERLYSPQGQLDTTSFLNYYQFLVLLGVCMFLIYAGYKEDIYLLFGVIFLGGFIFHTFWEGKCQYTLFYFVFLLPVFIRGCASGLRRFGQAILYKDRSLMTAASIICLVPVAVILIIAAVIQYSGSGVLETVFLRDQQEEEYRRFRDQHTYIDVDEGDYYITACTGDDRRLMKAQANDDISGSVGILEGADEESCISIVYSRIYDSYSIRFPGGDRQLDIPGGRMDAGADMQYYSINSTSSQQWRFREADGEGNVNILSKNNRALTWDAQNGRVYLDDLTDRNEQKWKLTVK